MDSIQKKQEKCLLTMLQELVRLMRQRTESILNSLVTKEIITSDSYDDIQSYRNPQRQMTEIILSVTHGQHGAFEKFYAVLMEQGLDDVAQRMLPHCDSTLITKPPATTRIVPGTKRKRVQDPVLKDRVGSSTSESQRPTVTQWSIEDSNFFNTPFVKCDINENSVQQKIRNIGTEYFELPRGFGLIINNEDFSHARCSGFVLMDRDGTNVDASAMNQTLSDIGFYDLAVKRDRTASQIQDDVTNAVKAKASEGSFVCVILSHGREGEIFGVDGKLVDVHTLTSIVTSNLPPATPKIFIIQACQGSCKDMGTIQSTPMETEAAKFTKTLTDTPVFKNTYAEKELNFLDKLQPPDSDGETSSRHANVFIALATIEGYVSWRTAMGSWFIQALVSVIRQFAHEEDLDGLMTKAKRLVAEKEHGVFGYKQVATHRTTMTKKLFFFPGVKRDDVDRIRELSHK